MGTQNAWEGSGGRDWSRVKSESETLLNEPSSANAETVLPLLSDALDWLGHGTDDAPDAEPPQGDSQATALRPLPAGSSWTSRPGGARGEARTGPQRGA